MRIEQKSPLQTYAPASSVRRSGEKFDVRGSKTASLSAPAAAAPLSTIDALLALQGEDDLKERRRKAARRGKNLLDAMDRLKAALLSGKVPLQDLKSIAARLAERSETSGDPALDALLQQIDLRAQVELAKLGLE